MKVTYFIDRPVFSMVISILIVIVGFIGLTLLPIDQYPQITPPVVKISASYPGASALTVSQAVATPIEQELNGTPGMLYMESSSSNSGGFSATVTFDISADPDLAAVEIQNRVKLAESRLPAEVIQNGISVEKQAPSQLMTLCLTSDDPKFDEIYLSNFATINVLDVLRRIPGVGRVSNIGSRYYAMQIWVQPDKLANFGLTVQDVQNALKDQNRESAAGVLGQQPIEGLDITIPILPKGGSLPSANSRKSCSVPMQMARSSGCATWHASRSKPSLTTRKAVSTEGMLPYSAFTCYREQMPWKWQRT